jgi:hypothetical protein
MNIAKPDCYYIKIKKYTKLYIIHQIIYKYIYCKKYYQKLFTVIIFDNLLFLFYL